MNAAAGGGASVPAPGTLSDLPAIETGNAANDGNAYFADMLWMTIAEQERNFMRG